MYLFRLLSNQNSWLAGMVQIALAIYFGPMFVFITLVSLSQIRGLFIA